MLEYMVEYGRRGFKLSEKPLSHDISHLEIYKLSTLTEEELRFLMFYLDVKESSINKQPLVSMSVDEMKMEYISFRKRQIDSLDNNISEYLQSKKKRRLKFDMYISKMLDILKYH